MTTALLITWLGAAQAGLPCGTMAQFDDFIGSTPEALPPRPPSDEKGVRDAMSGVCNGTEVSDNFILKWGLDAPPADDEVELIMASLEDSWNHQLEIMGHSAPYGTDEYLFNVYVGDSGGCAPSADGKGGYYTTDWQGWPIIVLSQGVFNNLDYGQTTVAHEFYHAVQHAENAYTTRGPVQWWWEATAMWVEAEVYPGTEDYYSFLHGYAFEPHLQLNAFSPLTGLKLLEEYHQYGAAIWPRYLTEYVTSWTTIRDSWHLGEPDGDPIEFIAEVLAEELGADIDDVFGDFAAHNATWDYYHGDNIASYLDYKSETTEYRSRDRRITDVITSAGTTSWSSPPSSTLPQRYGYNTLRMYNPPEGEITLRFKGESRGSFEGNPGSEARWTVRTVLDSGNRLSYADLPVEEGEGELTISTSGTEDDLYLVIAVSSPSWNEGETFNYQYQFDASETTGGGSSSGGGSSGTGTPDVDGGMRAYQPREKGGGCSQVPGAAGSAWGVMMLGLLIRRRQDRGW
jgi:hypothetical protein